MTMTRKTRALAVLALTTVALPSTAASMQNADKASATPQNSTLGWYGGASIGRSEATIDNERITGSLLESGFSSTLTNDRRDLAFKVLGGYQMNRYFALEGGYFDLGKFGYTASTTPTGTLTGVSRMRGLNLDLLARLPVTDRFSVFGRAGVTYAQTRDTFSGTGAVVVNNPNPRERDTNLKFGVGMEYAFTPSLSARAEIERYRMNDAVGNRGDIDMASIGLIYRFGGPVQSRVAAAPASEPVFTQPQPAPAPVAAPAPIPAQAPAPAPVSEKVSFEAGTLFGFDKSALTAQGKGQLDELIAKQQGIALEVVIAVGHTDSAGSDAYNQRLSVRRADAVKAYLVSRGMEAKKVFSEGKGEKQPVADNRTEAGRTANRRVVIEVVGSRTR